MTESLNNKQALLKKLEEALAITKNIDKNNYMQGADIQTLKEFINDKHGGSQASFAMANKIHKQQVSNNLKAGAFIVVDGEMYRHAKGVV